MGANFPETERHLDLVSSMELLLSQVGINTFGLVWFSFQRELPNNKIAASKQQPSLTTNRGQHQYICKLFMFYFSQVR